MHNHLPQPRPFNLPPIEATPIRVYGQIIGPMGQPEANIKILLRAITTNQQILQDTWSETTTDTGGNYDFQVYPGKYAVFYERRGQKVRVNNIFIYSDSAPGNLQSFFLDASPDQLTPLMVLEAKAAFQNSTAAMLRAREWAEKLDSPVIEGDDPEYSAQYWAKKAAQSSAEAIGLTWRDDWKSTANYAINDAVFYQGSAWIAIAVNTSITPVDGATWNIFAQKGDKGEIGIRWRSLWNSTLTYEYSDAVQYQGSSWFCLKENVNQLPQENAFWSLMAQHGEAEGDYLAISNNLGEIKGAGVGAQQAARDNIGAVSKETTVNGHALADDINVTSQDIFNTQAISIAAGTNLNTLTTAGVYYTPSNANATIALNYPEPSAGSLLVLKDAGSTQIYTVYDGGRQYRRGYYGSAWVAWSQAYESGHKPTAEDADAVSATDGGTFHKPITIEGDLETLTIQAITPGSAILLLLKNADGTRRGYMGFPSDVTNELALYNYWSESILSLNADGSIHLNTTGGESVHVSNQVIPVNYENFDSRYVQKTQLGTVGWYEVTDGTVEAPAGCVITGGGPFTADAGYYDYRPMQYIINGTPYTAAYSSVMEGAAVGFADIFVGIPISSIPEMINCQIYNNAFLAGGIIDGDKSILSLRDDNGIDFYIGRHLLTGSIFIVYENDSGIIKQIDSNPLNMWPVGMSIRGLDSLPEGCDLSGNWRYDGSGVTAIVPPDEFQARKYRDKFISMTDILVVQDYTINDVYLSTEQRQELFDTRLNFKKWPAASGWPNIPLPDVPEWIMSEITARGYIAPVWPQPATQ